MEKNIWWKEKGKEVKEREWKAKKKPRPPQKKTQQKTKTNKQTEKINKNETHTKQQQQNMATGAEENFTIASLLSLSLMNLINKLLLKLANHFHWNFELLLTTLTKIWKCSLIR